MYSLETCDECWIYLGTSSAAGSAAAAAVAALGVLGEGGRDGGDKAEEEEEDGMACGEMYLDMNRISTPKARQKSSTACTSM